MRLSAIATGLAAALIAFTSGCSKKNEVWVYTSVYKETIEEIRDKLRKDLPGIEVQFFQGGSEIVASKVNAELASGRSKADILLTSDPFWYLELKRAGKLLPYQSPAAGAVPREFSDPDFAYVCNRIPVMVMGYNSEALKPNDLPMRWKDLTLPKWKDKVTMGNPLESGTNFTAVAFLANTYGWEFFQGLRHLNVLASGGNSSVITRMETRERPLGVVLLENILKAWSKGSPVRPIYPLDGVIAIPSPIAIMKDTPNPEAAKKVYDWFFTSYAQNAIVRSGMYSPLPHIVQPEKGRPWAEVRSQMMQWNPEILASILDKRDGIKNRFAEVVLR